MEDNLPDELREDYLSGKITAGQVIALTAIRTCYSANKPSEIVSLEGEKYFKRKATEGEGKEVDRLIRHIMKSGHTSTVEHLGFSFAVEGVSRALLSQLTRHRIGFGFSVQSQRYVKFSSDSKSEGFDYVVPEKVKANEKAYGEYLSIMDTYQSHYDHLIRLGIPQEDARSVLPQSATCNLVLTVNLRALLDFYSKRAPKKGAQFEITQLAEQLKEKVISVEPWCEAFFGGESK
ncbi:FAD-dependent thymidylate synthase [Bacillus cereus]|uniref:FAD-dependent thymidylate synthase n=1 Tax=Bacillus cereus TaxID=1396 RepID=UPI003BF8026E